MSLTQGSILENRYRVDRLLGQGGMGAVYRAWDVRLGQWVALKENALTTVEARAQFEREAKILARLHHSNLPKVIDHFITAEGLQYLVMSFIDGVNLAELLASRGRQSPADVMTWLGQVCDALIYLHNQNPPIIHRDIKPQNIKIAPDGHVFLVDFGLSKVGSAYQSTASGALGVTPGFSPWEQYGQGHTDQRSDVYALAATLYAMLTGETPPDSVQRGLAGVALRPPRDLNPALSPTLEHAILHGLETQPTNRPPTVAALRSEVETSLAATGTVVIGIQPPLPPAQPHTPYPAPGPSPPVRKRRLPVWIWIVVATLAVVLLAVGVQAMRAREGDASDQLAMAVTKTANPAVIEVTIISGSPTPTLGPPTTMPIQPNHSPVPPTDTPTASSTPTATSTPTITPTATPTPVIGRLVFAGNPRGFSHLHLVAGNGRNRREITYGAEHFWNPKLSQDGSRLAFASKVNGNTEVFVADGEGGNARPISMIIDATSGNPTRLIADGNSPAWSPDGMRMVYKPAGVRQVLYVADESGQRLNQLADSSSDAWSPDWSP